MGDSFQEQSKDSADMPKFCALIPCHNNAETLAGVVRSLPEWVDVIVVDDGSDVPVAAPDGRTRVLRSDVNRGKAEALKAGFAEAAARGFTHAITIDADGQHPTSSFPQFVSTARRNPECVIVGVRDFTAADIPPERRFMNKFSNFWFAYETGIKLSDTQCGYRCYPLAQISKLRLRGGGFVYEAELLVRAAWAGIGLCEVAIPAVYTPESLEASHYRPIVDTAKFSLMNAKFSFMATFFSKKILCKLSVSE